MDKIEVKIKRLSDTAIAPTYGSEKAAGLDLYADLGYDEECSEFQICGQEFICL